MRDNLYHPAGLQRRSRQRHILVPVRNNQPNSIGHGAVRQTEVEVQRQKRPDYVQLHEHNKGAFLVCRQYSIR